MALVSFAFSLVDEEVFKFNRDLCFGGFFFSPGWCDTESCSTLGWCSGVGMAVWGVKQRISEGLKVAVPQVRGFVPHLPSELGADLELGFHLS